MSLLSDFGYLFLVNLDTCMFLVILDMSLLSNFGYVSC